MTRLTPEVPFPECEGQPATYYANPFPLSEEHYLVAWSDRPLKFQGQTNDAAALGVYLYDAFGNLTLVYRDPKSKKLRVLNSPSDKKERSVADVLGVTVKVRLPEVQ